MLYSAVLLHPQLLFNVSNKGEAGGLYGVYLDRAALTCVARTVLDKIISVLQYSIFPRMCWDSTGSMLLKG